MGFFDICAPLLTPLHRWLAVWMPAAVEIALWASLCAWASMGLYRLLSRQQQLQKLKPEVRAATLRIVDYDGDFSGMLTAVAHALRLALRQIRLTLLPAILGSLPLLFIVTWLSNTFEYESPRVGQTQSIKLALQAQDPLWPADTAVARVGPGEWQVKWPDAAHPIALKDQSGHTLLSLPLSAPVPAVSKWSPWNALIGNPAGYVPDQAVVDTVEVPLAPLDIVPVGPSWLRSWITLFLFVLISWSLWLKKKWRLL